MDVYFDDDDDGDAPSRHWRAAALVVVLAAGAWFGYHRLASDHGIGFDPPSVAASDDTEAAERDFVAPLPTHSPAARPAPTAAPTTAAPTTSRPTSAAATTAVPTTSTAPAVVTTVIVTAPTSTAPTTTVAPTAPGSVLPNGALISAVVSFDGDAVTMRGSLPNQQAFNNLFALVAAANTTGKPISNEITIDPDAPGGDSVRVVGLDPHPFPEGTSDIYPQHGTELDRVAGLLNQYPRVRVVVVGHTDQRGPSARNAGIAEERAKALVTYLVSRGVDPARLTPVAIGEMQPTSQDDNVIALALNRRAEFILYGLASEGAGPAGFR